jgi:hypothetical protein
MIEKLLIIKMIQILNMMKNQKHIIGHVHVGIDFKSLRKNLRVEKILLDVPVVH